jgi:predicted metal-dependent peptidase
MSDVITGKKTKGKKSKKFENLIGPTDKKVDAAARDRLIQARVNLLLKQPFYGNLSTRLQLTNADDWCGTAATDSVRLYYNSRFIMMLKVKEVEFLVAHEVLHVVYDHIGRLEHRDPSLFNCANDYAVNADLKRHQIGEFIKTVPALYDPKYDGWSSEAIYEDLLKNVEKINLDDLIDKLLDEHMHDEEDNENGEDQKDREGKSSRVKMTPEQREQARQEMKQAIINAAKSAEPGTLPSGVERMIDAMTNPVMPWRELIQTNLTSCLKVNYSYMRPSRKGWHSDAIMPGMIPGEEIDVAVFIDLSGSISKEQARLFISEVSGMINSFDGFKLYLACFDTEVYNPQSFSSENMDSVDTYELAGGGGTDFTCIFDHLTEESIVPARLIVFTDGYPCDSWGTEDYCDTTWVIHGTTAVKPPWGTWAYYDEHKKK